MATSNTPVPSAPVLVFAPQSKAQNLIITNTGKSSVYLGQTGVTAATGFPLEPNQQINLPRVTKNIYAVSGVGVTKSPTNTLSADESAAGTALAVASGGTSFTNGMAVLIQDGNNSEVVTVGAGSTGTSVVVSALAHAHATGTAFGQLSSTGGSSVRVVSGT